MWMVLPATVSGAPLGIRGTAKFSGTDPKGHATYVEPARLRPTSPSLHPPAASRSGPPIVQLS